ncbi:unnamed protein product [Schistosoma curassoni]|uniref:Sema domain-containing protein n=1 Tax=Schistosoma curassoni TaxID=6186 RepID=A0A183JZ09_9TREM|nr:unnamed protein product [Schistosoma curassoni]
MIVGGNQQKTLNLGFVLFGTRQKDVPVILRELILPNRFYPVTQFHRVESRRTAIDQSRVGICASFADCPDITLSYKLFKQEWIVASSGIQEARFILFGTRQLDVPASQSWCSLWDSNPVPFASNAIMLST